MEGTASSDRIKRFIEACEIEGQEHALTSREYRLTHGTRVGGGAGRYLYRFDQARKLSLSQDSTLSLSVNGEAIDASFVRKSGETLIIALAKERGDSIAEATLVVRNGELLSALVARLSGLSESDTPFNGALAEKILNLDSLSAEPVAASVVAPEGLTDEQRLAVEGLSSRDVSFLWGPPGTGKSSVLAATIHKLFTENRRVLLVANTNQAVDTVLEALCKRISGRAKLSIPEGSIIRIGPVSKESLAEGYGSQIELSSVLRRGQEKTAERIELMRLQHSRFKEDVSRLESWAALARSEAGLREKLAELEARRRATAPGFFATLRRLFFGTGSVKTVVVDETVDLDAEIDLLRSGLEKLEKSLAAVNRAHLDSDLVHAREREHEIHEARQSLEEVLHEIERSTLHRARVVATSATRAFLQPENLGQFDVVVIDEASMLPLPVAYLLAGLSRSQFIAAGDFRQLPAITLSADARVKQWYGRDIFEVSGVIDRVDRGETHPSLFSLTTQFRCNQSIVDLFNAPFYGGRLATKYAAPEALSFDDPLSAVSESAVILFDTSSLQPTGFTVAKSKCNLTHALVARSLVRGLTECCARLSTPDIGVIAPYRPQVELLQELFAEEGIEGVSVGTVHRFQGDERPLIVLDLTESSPHRLGSFLGATSLRETGARLLNVALSRARDKLLIIADLAHLRTQLHSSHLLFGILNTIEAEGRVLDASVLTQVPSEGAQQSSPSSAARTQSCTRALFLSTLLGELRCAKVSVSIASPRIAKSLVKVIAPLFLQRSSPCVVKITVPNFSSAVCESQEEYEQCLELLRASGALVEHSPVGHRGGHVIIDEEISWFGGLDPLACLESDSGTMTRVSSGVAVRSIRKSLSVGAPQDALQPRVANT